MRTNKNTSKIILAVIVAFLATMISYSAFSNMQKQLGEQQKLIELMQNTTKSKINKDNFPYAVSTKDLKAGELVADEDVDFKKFDFENKDAFENRSDVINKVLLKDIASGETFTTSHIAKVSNDDITLKEGYRALTLPADKFQGKSSKMAVGSNVDIFNSSGSSEWDLENIKIISFEGAKNAVGISTTPDITSASSITFEVPADSIADFISNASRGGLTLVARNPGDKYVFHKKNSYDSFAKNYKGGSYSSLPNLPSSVPISNLPGNLSGLPQPIKPQAASQAVEIIEANVKSKVTFD